MTPAPSFADASLWCSKAQLSTQAREALSVLLGFMVWPSAKVPEAEQWSWRHLTVEQLGFMCGQKKRRTGTRRMAELRALGVIRTELPPEELGMARWHAPHVIRVCVDRLEELYKGGVDAFRVRTAELRARARAQRAAAIAGPIRTASSPPPPEQLAKAARRSAALEAAAQAEQLLGALAGVTGFSRGRAVEVYEDLGDDGRTRFLADVEDLVWALQRAPAHSPLGEAAAKGRRIWSSRTWRRRVAEARALRQELEAGAAAADVLAAVELPDDFVLRGAPVTSATDAWSTIEGKVGANFRPAGLAGDELVLVAPPAIVELLHAFPERPLGLDGLGIAIRVRARPPDTPTS